MARGLMPTAAELEFAPGDRVYVERYSERGGAFEKFEDTISCVDILVDVNRWTAEYFFEKADNGVKAFSIKKLIARPRTFNPIPQPKFEIGDVLKYVHHWDKDKEEAIDEVRYLSIIWDMDESAVRYWPVRKTDLIYETDVKARYELKESYEIRENRTGETPG